MSSGTCSALTIDLSNACNGLTAIMTSGRVSMEHLDDARCWLASAASEAQWFVTIDAQLGYMTDRQTKKVGLLNRPIQVIETWAQPMGDWGPDPQNLDGPPSFYIAF